MVSTADLLRSVRTAASEPTRRTIASALATVGWAAESLDQPVRHPEVVVAHLGGQPKLVVVSASEDAANGRLTRDTADAPIRMGYSSEAPYTLIWTPERIELHETTHWNSVPGDTPLLDEANRDAAATANLIELLSPASIVREAPSLYRAEAAKQQPDLAQTLGDALAELRASIATNFAVDDNGTHEDLLTMRLFHQLLFIRFIEDRHPDRAVGRLADSLAANEPQAALKRMLRHYSKTLQSELFTRPALEVDLVPPVTLKHTIKALTEPWQRLRLDFALTPNDVSGRLYESYLEKRTAIDRDESALFPVATQTDDRSQRGSFYTPTAVATELARATLTPWLNAHQPTRPEEVRVLDPACGSGAFLLASYRILREYFENRNNGVPLDHAARRALLANSIYGADQDESALMLAQVALYEEADLGADSSLPAMGRNLHHGDSLLSPPGSGRTDGVPWDAVLRGGKFQIILANPPFGAQRTRASRSTSTYREQLKAAFPDSSAWGADLAYYFVDLSMRLLDESGGAGFVLPRKFLTGPTAARARRLLGARGIRSISDYRGAKLFPSVDAYVALVTAGTQETDVVEVSDVLDSRVDASLLLDRPERDENVRTFAVAAPELQDAVSWSAFELRWRALRGHVRGPWRELGRFDDIVVATGVQTGRNKQFVVTPTRVTTTAAVVNGEEVPLRVCPRFVKGPNVLPFRLVADTDLRVVLPFKVTDERHREVERALASLGGPVPNTQLGKIDTWLGPKVLLRAFDLEPCAALDETGDVVAPKGTAGAFAIARTGNDIEHLRGMVTYLNSAFAQWWLRGSGEPRGDESIELLEGQVKRLPWPDVDAQAWSSLALLADEVLLTLSTENATARTRDWWAARRRVDEAVFDVLEVSTALRDIIRREVVRRG